MRSHQLGIIVNAHAPFQDDPAKRRARHLRVCEELAELGMDLARAAAREALCALTSPIEHRMPGMAAPPTCATEEPGILFTRLSRAVRQAILLEARIAAGAFDRRLQFTLSEPRPASSAPRPHDDHDHESCEPLEDDLACDADRSVPEILTDIREQLGLPAEPASPADPPRQIRFAKPPADLATDPRRPRNGRPPPKPN